MPVLIEIGPESQGFEGYHQKNNVYKKKNGPEFKRLGG